MAIMEASPPVKNIVAPGLLSAEAYFLLYPETTSRQELIVGKVLSLPSPTRTHQRILAKLHHKLDDFVSQGSLGSVDLAPLDVVLDEQTVVQPDIFFVSRGSTQCHLGADDRWYGAPDLCIEILSADIRHDRVKKMALYAQFGVGEYWIVDPVGRYVEIHRLEATSGRLVLHSDFADGEMLSTPSLPGLQIPLGEVFPPKE